MMRIRYGFVLAVAASGLGIPDGASPSEPAKSIAGPAATTSTAPAGAQELRKKLKEMDARYRSGFTATGIDIIYTWMYRDMPPQKMRWKITMAGDRIAYEQQVVEILKWEDVLGPDEDLPPVDERGGGSLVSRTVVFFGPEFTGQHQSVGDQPPAGPVAPTPDDERGQIGFCAVTVTDPDAPNFVNYTTNGKLRLVGRGVSKYVDRITGIYHREDGMTSLTVEDTKARKFEIVVDPKADFMVRRFKGTDGSDMILSGLKRNGGLFAPESIERVGERCRHTILSISPKPDLEFLKKAEARMHGPYIAPTIFEDWRRKKHDMKQFKQGESWTDE